MMKKAQNLSMNVIIIAAIALLVLVILAVLLFGAAGRTEEGTGCNALPNSQCAGSSPGDGWFENRAFSDSCGDNQQCYQRIGGGDEN
jgi:hypothetical protein